MEKISQPSTFNGSATHNSHTHHHLNEAAWELMRESKKAASELYEDGKHKISELQETVKQYSGDVAHKVQERPIKALFTACAVGYILSLFLRK